MITPDQLEWDALEAELDLWVAEGHTARFWWRDDDAEIDSPALRRLLSINRKVGGTLALAAVPAKCDQSLVEALANEPVWILQHGFAHKNHAPRDKKKCELGSGRPLEQILEELAVGKKRLEAMFGEKFLPVLVPPWNRIDDAVIPHLAGLGYLGLSTYALRHLGEGQHFPVTNCDLDIFQWKPARRFKAPAQIIEDTLAALRQRRLGAIDAQASIGLLTHHLVHDDDVWPFLERFVMVLTAHPGLTFMDPRAAFGLTSLD